MWVVQKAEPAKKKLESPKKYFRGVDRYTLGSRGKRDLAVENALAMTETWFAEALSNIRAGKPLDGYDRVKLAFFTSAMMVRTDRIPGVVAESLRTISRQAAKLDAKRNAEAGLSKDACAALTDVVGDTVSAGLKTGAEILVRMNVSIFITEDDADFVTGDEPVSVIVPGERNAYPAHPDVEITLPLPPRHMAYYSWKIPRLTYMPWDRYKVDRINSRTIGTCHREFVSWKGIVRPEWFIDDFGAERFHGAAS